AQLPHDPSPAIRSWRARQATGWLSFAARLRAAIGCLLPPDVEPMHERDRNALWEVLGEAAFAAAWEQAQTASRAWDLEPTAVFPVADRVLDEYLEQGPALDGGGSNGSQP